MAVSSNEGDRKLLLLWMGLPLCLEIPAVVFSLSVRFAHSSLLR